MEMELNTANRKKRPAVDPIDDERFTAKRLGLLTLDSAHHGPNNHYIHVATAPSQDSRALRPASINGDDSMQVDDTRNRVYVHDLDAELAEVDTEERRLVFLPDIEQYFSKLPKQVLTHKKDGEHEGQQLVLYTEPKSLTVDDEVRDSVRKAILEARHRARERAVECARQEDMNARYGPATEVTETAHGYSAGYGMNQEQEQDPDAMDVD